MQADVLCELTYVCRMTMTGRSRSEEEFEYFFAFLLHKVKGPDKQQEFKLLSAKLLHTYSTGTQTDSIG